MHSLVMGLMLLLCFFYRVDAFIDESWDINLQEKKKHYQYNAGSIWNLRLESVHSCSFARVSWWWPLSPPHLLPPASPRRPALPSSRTRRLLGSPHLHGAGGGGRRWPPQPRAPIGPPVSLPPWVLLEFAGWVLVLIGFLRLPSPTLGWSQRDGNFFLF